MWLHPQNFYINQGHSASQIRSQSKCARGFTRGAIGGKGFIFATQTNMTEEKYRQKQKKKNDFVIKENTREIKLTARGTKESEQTYLVMHHSPNVCIIVETH